MSALFVLLLAFYGLKVLGFGLLALLSLVVAALAVRTLIAVWRRQLCVPE